MQHPDVVRAKFEDTLRYLDSIIKAHDYSPTTGSCLHNLRTGVVELGRYINEAEH